MVSVRLRSDVVSVWTYIVEGFQEGVTVALMDDSGL